MKLTQAQANTIFETILICQEYDFTPQLGHELRMIKNELEKSYESSQKAKEELVKKHKGAYGKGNIDFGTKENRESYMNEEKEILESKREFKIEILPIE